MENDHPRLAVVEDTREGMEMQKDEGKVTTLPVEKRTFLDKYHFNYSYIRALID